MKIKVLSFILLFAFKIYAEQFNYTITVSGDEMKYSISKLSPVYRSFSYGDSPFWGDHMHYEDISLDEFPDIPQDAWIIGFKLDELSARNINIHWGESICWDSNGVEHTWAGDCEFNFDQYRPRRIKVANHHTCMLTDCGGVSGGILSIL